jgi:hypothetical protein
MAKLNVLSSFEGKAVAVHLNPWGDIDLVQRDKEPQGLYSNYPDWMVERVALIKMANDRDGQLYRDLNAMRVNESYFILWLNRSELIQIGKLIRKLNGNNT